MTNGNGITAFKNDVHGMRVCEKGPTPALVLPASLTQYCSPGSRLVNSYSPSLSTDMVSV